MITSVLIILVSTVLLVYWFRYTCLLMLRAHAGRDYAAGMATANGLKFYEIQGRVIREAPAVELLALQKSLERDYRLLTYLIKHTAALEVGGLTIEHRMLMLDFKAMQMLCAINRWLGLSRARSALEEMSSILNHLANAMGERLKGESQA